ncbi:MAG: hypothetical protein IT371_21025 [Deltaproteobacteria bacterium]|nr:hypothetical protein [Deltaproteobacteria bacterium]
MPAAPRPRVPPRASFVRGAVVGLALALLGTACSPPAEEPAHVTPEGYPLLSPKVLGEGDREGDPAPDPVRGMSANTLPATVDRAPNLPRVRDQGDRGTCMSFAATAMIEAHYGLKSHLAVEQTVQRIGLPLGWDVYVVWRLQGHRLAEERDWPYGGAPAAGASSNSRWGIDELRATGTDPAVLMRYLAENPKTTIMVGMIWDSEVIKGPVLDKPNLSDLEISLRIAGCNFRSTCGGHAVLLVGYERRTDPYGQPEVYFKFRNSWSDRWGYAGYGFVSGAYLRTYGKHGSMILRGPAVGGPPPSVEPPVTPPTPPATPGKTALKVEIASPGSGQVLSAGPVVVRVNVTGGARGMVQTRLLVDGGAAAEDSAPPYELATPALTPGVHELTVLARDAAGEVAQQVVTVRVEARGGEQVSPPPSVEGGDGELGDEASAGGCTVAGKRDRAGFEVAFAWALLGVALSAVQRRRRRALRPPKRSSDRGA